MTDGRSFTIQSQLEEAEEAEIADKRKDQNLIVSYARNREQLKKTNKAISQLVNPGPEFWNYNNIDLNSARKAYLESEGGSWQGWIEAIKLAEDYSLDQYRLAWLLDKKKRINGEAGQIKRNIYARGAAIIRQIDTN